MKKFTSIKDERLFIPLKAEKSHCYQTYTTRNKKENASGRRSMIPDGNLDSHKETKNARNGENKGNYSHISCKQFTIYL